MTNTNLFVLIAVAIAAALVIWAYLARRRARLKARFGPEYERVVRDAGSAHRAESVLEVREQRVSRYQIRPLSRDQGRYFNDAWRRVQAKFVDDPAAAVSEADALVTELMTARGYPMSDFERRAEDISVDHSGVVHHYREAHALAARHEREHVATEELRQALVRYRALFDDLLDLREPVREPERKRA